MHALPRPADPAGLRDIPGAGRRADRPRTGSSGISGGTGHRGIGATCQAWTGEQPPSPSSSLNELNGVAVLSPFNAWAVGRADENTLIDVTVTAAGNAWAVGDFGTVPGLQTLILHWNGRAWTKQASPSTRSRPGS